MIIFKPEEYNAWAALNEKYLKLRNEAREKYTKNKDRGAYDRALYKLENNEINERDKIEAPAKIRTVKSFSTDKVHQDAKATIYYYAYQDYIYIDTYNATHETDEPVKPACGGVVDLKIDEHLTELQERGARDEWEDIQELLDRYKNATIAREDCEPFKDYELIRVEIPVTKEMSPIKKDTGKSLVISNTKFPTEFITNTDKVTSKLFTGAIEPLVDCTIGLERRGSTKQLNAYLTINYNDLENIELLNRPKGLTSYDREVHDAILSLNIIGGNEVVTDLMIYKAMTGNPSAKLTDKIREKINESMAVLRGTIIKINAEEEAKAYNVDGINYEGNLLMIERVEVTLKGKNTTNAYRLRRTPILYEYANGKNQIARVPMELINTKVRKEPEIIELQGYLLRRILAMQNSSLSRNILYSTIFENLNISSDRKKKSKVNQSIQQILDEWKDKAFILDYTVNKKGNSVVSVTINP